MPEPGWSAAQAMRFRGGGFAPRPRRLVSVLAIVGLLAFWQLASARGWVSPIMVPSPADIARSFAELAASGALAKHVGTSLWRISVGWSLGTLFGLALGLAMGIFSQARAVGLPVVSALFPIPKIAVLPLLILWLGIGEPSKVATIALGVFFPTVIATFSAVDNVPRSLIRMGQSFNLPGHAVVWKIVVPGALPGILAGFRITASIALILVVAAEMIGAEHGIGAFILTAGNLMRTDQLLAGVTMLSALGLLIAWGLGRLERWLLRWR
jgi:ABC-type nitrate/sulfonate/bicarbonate transport system permease component